MQLRNGRGAPVERQARVGVALLDGTGLAFAHDPATGRLGSVTTAHGTTSVGYDSAGRVWTAGDASQMVTYGYVSPAEFEKRYRERLAA